MFSAEISEVTKTGVRREVVEPVVGVGAEGGVGEGVEQMAEGGDEISLPS